jgi:hypothetical protein
MVCVYVHYAYVRYAHIYIFGVLIPRYPPLIVDAQN